MSPDSPSLTPGDRRRALAAEFDAAVHRAVDAINALHVAGLKKLQGENREDAAAVAAAIRAGWLLRCTMSQATTTRTAWLRADLMDPNGGEQRLWLIELQRESQGRTQ